MKKVKIELTPYEAISLLSFLAEYREEMELPICASLKDATESLFDQVTINMSPEQLEDAKQETKIHQLMGRCPEREQ